ncbi:exonuclease subunit SbcD [Ferrimonas kyonanensis]|uniref:exonuclease subunit SbcD n=1 Tax=Ferrimonas kyonanensis TaxID=364763 RepID=UPI0004117F33|nr:exonuclease subunit SbcD [Ferrimonas kyonanensis]
MRILHTSDWHLGQHFYNKSRALEHFAFFDWLMGQIDELSIDAVIVAGDIFDTGTPPSYARELYNALVVAMQKQGCQLVVLAGNHDSVATLNESRELLAYMNTQVVAAPADDLSQQVLELKDKQGQVGALVCAVPYLRPRDVMRSSAGLDDQQKRQALQQGIADHYQQVFALAQQRRAELDRALPIIATGHLTTIGASCSDSVRDIYVGTLDAFSASQFPQADYVALGHIHRSQRVTESEHIRYSGSPIPLSFDELSSAKSVLMVEFEQGRLGSVTPVEIPRFQPMAVVKGDLGQIQESLQQFADHDGAAPVWLDIEVVSDDYLNDLQPRIEAMIAELPVEVLLLRRARSQPRGTLAQQQKETLAELSIDEVFARRLQDETFDGDQGEVRKERLNTLFAQVVEQLQHTDTEQEASS